MKPICLTMSAFGSFPGKEEIQFDTLGEAPLFLINGPTGSGKTTILDAICFALYGETTGVEREARQMRCDFASTDTLTEVSLIFELAGQRYHIRRVPEQPRPKARGEGTTIQAPEAQLWKLDTSDLEKEPQVIVSNKVKDATSEIEILTGLTVNQFRQVMVLPQGKFRQLLLAESKDREHIFGTLFQTQIYKKLEEKLKQKANTIALEVKNKQQLQQGVLEGAGLLDEDALTIAMRDDQAALASTSERKNVSQKNVQSIEKAYQDALALEQSFLQLEETQKVVNQLQSRKEEVSLKRQRIALAESAERMQPIMIELERHQVEGKKASAALTEVSIQLKNAEKQLQAMEVQKSQANTDLVTLNENKKTLDYLYALRERVTAFSRAQKQEQLVKTQGRKAKEQREKEEKAWKASSERQQKIQVELTNLQKSLEENEGVSLQHASWEKNVQLKCQLQDLHRDLEVQERQLVALTIEGERLKKAAEDTCTYTKRLTLAWHQGQAAVLAKALNQGEACMVCGSLEHPAPAHLSMQDSAHGVVSDVPSDEQLEASRQREQEAQQQLLDARERYAQQAAHIKSMKQHYQSLCDALGDLQREPLEQLQMELQRLTGVLQKWHQDKEALRKAHQQLEELRTVEIRLVQVLEEARALEIQYQSDHASASAVLQQASLELPEEYRQQGLLESRIQQLSDSVAVEERRQERLQQQWQEVSASCHALAAQENERKRVVEGLKVQLDAVSQRWQEALFASPFDSEENYHAYRLSAVELEDMRQLLSEFDKGLNEKQGALKQQQAQLSGQQRPVIAEIEAQLANAKQDYGIVETEWLALDKRVSLLLSTQKTLDEMKRQAHKLEESFALYGTLSSVANGHSYEKISLQRFVLGVLLDDVLIEASQRLNMMSKGRYLLLRKTEKAKGNKASGLELVVDDAYTGVQRPVATLSGGESFMAALSLALGLSDVVQAYSGGIRLDMLFIDEGFGSLDPESLELAIRTLLDLQEAGRMVGVISHVSDLKEQIPLRLDVVSSHRGSQTKLIGAFV